MFVSMYLTKTVSRWMLNIQIFGSSVFGPKNYKSTIQFHDGSDVNFIWIIKYKYCVLSIV